MKPVAPERVPLHEAEKLLHLLKGHFRNECKSLMRHFVNLLATIPGRDMRISLIRERLLPLQKEVLAESLQQLIEGALRRERGYREMLDLLVDFEPFEKDLGYDALSDLYAYARCAGYNGVCHILLRRRPGRILYKPGEVDENEFMMEYEIGKRRAMASGGDRYILDRLLFDKSNLVVRNLLRNPRITERDVIKIASMRPTTEGIIREIIGHRRWFPRYRVKKALVFNPYTPLHISLSLLNFLFAQDLRLAAKSKVLHKDLQKAAWELARKRS